MHIRVVADGLFDLAEVGVLGERSVVFRNCGIDPFAVVVLAIIEDLETGEQQ